MSSLRSIKMAAKELKEECKQWKEECKQECKQWKEECKQWKDECKQEYKQWEEESRAERRKVAKVIGKVVPIATAGGKIGLVMDPSGAMGVVGLGLGCALGLYLLKAEVDDRVAVNAVPPIADAGDLLKNIKSAAEKAAGSS